MRARSVARPTLLTLIGALVVVVACGTTVVPSGSPSAPALGSGSASIAPSGSIPTGSLPTASGASIPPASGGPGASTSPGGGAVATPSVEPFTPPPVMAHQDDEVCLALVSRQDAESALGILVGDISAEGTDPNFGLTCTYPAATGGGQLLLTTTTEDPASAYEAELGLATGYGQDPQSLEGLGDQAFYGKAAGEAPEQVVFTKGPVVVRIWNQTSGTIGMAPFMALAETAAAAIRAEIPPAP